MKEKTWKVFIFECSPQSMNTTAPPSCFLTTGAQSDKEKSVNVHGQEVSTDGEVFRGAGSQQGCRGNTWLVFNAPQRARSQRSSSTGQGPAATAAHAAFGAVSHANLTGLVLHPPGELGSWLTTVKKRITNLSLRWVYIRNLAVCQDRGEKRKLGRKRTKKCKKVTWRTPRN